MRPALALLTLALLAGCGGGGFADSLEDQLNLVSQQEARLQLIEAGDRSADLLAAFNAAALVLHEAQLDSSFFCGGQKGRFVEFAACRARLLELSTQRP